MDKSPDAFRTISEVAEVLDTPAHVLRFWESRFPQIRPVKRAGGRRYYRPADVALLTGIKHLLHDEGLTIRGVQKILREQGVRHVAALSGQDVEDEGEDAEAALEAALAANFGTAPDDPTPQAEVETAQIVALETALRPRDADAPAPNAPADILPLFDLHTLNTPTAEPVSAAVETTGDDLPLENAPKATETFAETAEGDIPEADISEAEVPEAGLWVDPELDDSFTPSSVTDDPAPIATIAAMQSDANAKALAPDAPLLARLRALPAGCFAHEPKAAALHDRLTALLARVSSPPATSAILTAL